MTRKSTVKRICTQKLESTLMKSI